MKKAGSILRIKHFSDSEDNDDDEEMKMDESENDEDHEEEAPASQNQSDKPKPKIGKKGILYISNIPRHMNVTICRELMEQFGEVGRIFLQPDKKGSKFILILNNNYLLHFNNTITMP